MAQQGKHDTCDGSRCYGFFFDERYGKELSCTGGGFKNYLFRSFDNLHRFRVTCSR